MHACMHACSTLCACSHASPPENTAGSTALPACLTTTQLLPMSRVMMLSRMRPRKRASTRSSSQRCDARSCRSAATGNRRVMPRVSGAAAAPPSGLLLSLLLLLGAACSCRRSMVAGEALLCCAARTHRWRRSALCPRRAGDSWLDAARARGAPQPALKGWRSMVRSTKALPGSVKTRETTIIWALLRHFGCLGEAGPERQGHMRVAVSAGLHKRQQRVMPNVQSRCPCRAGAKGGCVGRTPCCHASAHALAPSMPTCYLMCAVFLAD